MQTLQPSSATPAPSTAAELLIGRWPTLRYWPHLWSVSPKQAAFLVLDQLEAFFGGAAGPGKSDALIAAALQYADVPGYAAIIFRRTFSDLDLPGAAMDRAKDWLRPEVHWDDRGKTFTFPSGATLTFGYLEHEQDKYRYKSAEFQYVGFDELTQFSESQFEYLFTRLRATGDIRVPLRMRAASNPGDVGHGWVKRRYLTDRQPGVVFIPARLEDHPDEMFKRGYRDSLAKLDELTRRQYEFGDWDAAAGLAFRIPAGALIGDIEIPAGWDRFESMDFGVTNPTCVLAWAVDYDGNLIVFDSYYQADTLVSDHARAIEAHRQVWWPHGTSPVCYADPSMWARNGRTDRWGEPATDVTEFTDHGITGLVQANNKRRPGRSRLVELLKPDPDRLFPGWHPTSAGEHGAPSLFIVKDRCPELVRQLQDAPLLSLESGREGAGEIVDPDWESRDGHAVAAARYGAMSRPHPTPKPKEIPADPRAALLQRVEERWQREAEDPYEGRYTTI